MSKKWYVFLLFTLLLLLPALLPAQITINSSDLPVIGQNFSFYFVYDSTGQGIPVNVGSAGANQTWSFDQSAYPGGFPGSVHVVDPTTTPFASTFTNSNWCWELPLDTATSYIYFNVSSSIMEQVGMAWASTDSSIANPQEKPDTTLVFPLTFNTSWSFTSRDSFNLGPGLLLVTVVQSQVVVDGWGNVQLPAGTFPALRTREDRTTTQTVYFNGIPVATEQWSNISYQWLSNQGRGLLATITSLENETNPNFTKAETVQFQVGPVGIQSEEPLLAKQFELLPAYPNPFNPSTTISYRLAVRSPVTITVYSLLGQPVKTLVNGVQAPGEHRIQWDGTNTEGRPVASGVYLVEMRAGSFQQIQKVILNR